MQVVWAECSPYVRSQALHPIVGALAHHWRLDEPGALDRVAGALPDRRAEVLLADVLGRPHREDAEIAAMSAGRRRQEGLAALRDAMLGDAAAPAAAAHRRGPALGRPDHARVDRDAP